MFVYICVPLWGTGAATFVWVLWWIDVVLSVATCSAIVFLLMYVHDTDTLGAMTAVWLLPIVPCIVASASGAVVATVLPLQHALWTIIASFVLWGMGVPMAMLALTVYFQRLAVHKLPSKEVIVSVFLPLGPLGQGGFAAMELGKMALQIFPKTQTLHPDAGAILYVLGWAVAMVMWGFGFLWLLYALASITRSKFPFNMGWWGFTFPLGVWTLSTLQIGQELPSLFFKVLGTVRLPFKVLAQIV